MLASTVGSATPMALPASRNSLSDDIELKIVSNTDFSLRVPATAALQGLPVSKLA